MINKFTPSIDKNYWSNSLVSTIKISINKLTNKISWL